MNFCLLTAFKFYQPNIHKETVHFEFLQNFNIGITNYLNHSDPHVNFIGKFVAEILQDKIFGQALKSSTAASANSPANLELDFNILKNYQNLPANFKNLYLKLENFDESDPNFEIFRQQLQKDIDFQIKSDQSSLSKILAPLETESDSSTSTISAAIKKTDAEFLEVNANFKIFDLSQDKKLPTTNSQVKTPKHLRQALDMLDDIQDDPEQLKIIVEAIPQLLKKSPYETQFLAPKVINKFLKLPNKFELPCLEVEFLESQIFRNLIQIYPDSLLQICQQILKTDLSLGKNLMICSLVSSGSSILRNSEILDPAGAKSAAVKPKIEVIERTGKVLKVSKKLKNENSGPISTKFYQNKFSQIGPKIASTFLNLAQIYFQSPDFKVKHQVLYAAMINALANAVLNLENVSSFDLIQKRDIFEFAITSLEATENLEISPDHLMAVEQILLLLENLLKITLSYTMSEITDLLIRIKPQLDKILSGNSKFNKNCMALALSIAQLVSESVKPDKFLA